VVLRLVVDFLLRSLWFAFSLILLIAVLSHPYYQSHLLSPLLACLFPSLFRSILFSLNGPHQWTSSLQTTVTDRQFLLHLKVKNLWVLPES
jgi:hypothetical protein